MLFLLLAVEILKFWEEQVEKQIKRIGARQTGQREVEKTSHLVHRINCQFS